ncbi:hypothetical protein FE257_001610 [Aspergillus nanangensis]|uniref:SET domain-containing protein n=1 Tax=Aspergillus nanangensis TaxID=2582783 RepID=A0AAD4CTM5_ASPNN|nr:hypothetical protein FE257_001610 [Aspergillus nanangensis]
MTRFPGKEHETFTQWAISRGIQINGIAPARIPGRGVGMVASRDIEENQTMLTVPLKTMLNTDTIPARFLARFPEGTPKHCLIAAFLTLGDSDDGGEPSMFKDLDAWRSVWPSWQDFADSMPLLWPGHLRVSNSECQDDDETPSAASLLPPSASGLWNSFAKQKQQPAEFEIGYEAHCQNLLAEQEKRLMTAWDYVVAAFPDTDWETFVYHWLVVNSRSFYYVPPGTEEGDWNDAVSLVPWADYFNHADDADCLVKYADEKYTFTATRRYEKGEEIYMSYGAHSNDFLLVEYGFYLDNNHNDSIYLDDILLRQLSPQERKALASESCLGNFEVTNAGPSTNIEVAACLKYMLRRDWRRYVDGQSTKAFDPNTTIGIINDWISAYLKESTDTIDIIQSTLRAEHSQEITEPKKWEHDRLHTLLGRWKQIKQLCESALEQPSDNDESC